MRETKKSGRTLVALVATAAVVAFSVPAMAGGSVVTRGDFATFAAGTSNIGGHAVMVRAANGTTKVSIHVTGLDEDESYVSHVHNQACDDGEAGGHFKQDPGGVSTPPNEIWPAGGPFSPNNGGISNESATVDYFANHDAVSVVIHLVVSDTDKPKIACADLG